MIIVTGAAGFIGSNLIEALNKQGRDDILVVDDLSDGHKFVNLVNYNICDYIDYRKFLQQIETNQHLGNIEAVLHQGACSTTTEWNGQYMMDNNYTYSKSLLHYCLKQNIPFIYASSAAVYGNSTVFKEDPSCEKPINVYGYSKFLFDHYVRTHFSEFSSQVVGLRYFNVYGPNEQHKGAMASVAFHFHQQLLAGDTVKLFDASGGYLAGEQRRDFVYVSDIADLNLWLLEHPNVRGIFNAGSGRSQTFNDVANAVINYHGHGSIKYIPFPEHLKQSYQHFTEADIQALRDVGYTQTFKRVEEAVPEYLARLDHKSMATERV